MKNALGGSPGDRTVGEKRRGATLLVSIAILTLLAVFAIAFVQLVNFERHASANYVDAVRARMAARAGIQRAIAEMQRIATLKHYSDPRPVGDGGDGWAFRYVAPESAGGDSYGRELSLLTTIAPSFGTSDSSRKLFGVDLSYSGALSSSYGNNSIDAYKLKIIDAASQLNLNHPDEISIQRMLKNLLRCASELDAQWPDLTETEANTLAQAVIAARPETGFNSLSEVHTVLRQELLGAGNPKNVVTPQYNRWLYADATGNLRLPLRDMLTVNSWVDDRVIRPWALNFNPTATPNPILGRRDLPLQPRAPINLNTASVPVLTAALAELRGAGRFGTFGVSYASGKTLAQSIRTRVTSATGGGPFKTWIEFERWVDGVPFGGLPGTTWAPGGGDTHNLTFQDLDGNASQSANEPNTALASGSNPIKTVVGLRYQGVRDLVKAALNPNSMINKFGAQATHGGSVHGNFALPRLIDKSDLIRHGTEGCFDSMGVYEITSLGMVLVQNEREPTSPGMLILAEQTQQVIVHIYNVVRLSTQADFESNRALMATGDFIEAFDRKWTYTAPGVNRPRYGPPLGQSVPRSSAPWGFEGWPGVTSYPVYSLHRDDQSTNYAMRTQYGAADWDGYLALSNLLAIPVQPMDFVVCFARGYLDAFKVRTWWEPKDQDPTNGQPKADPTNPAQTVPATRGHDPQNGFTDLQALATPKGRVPMLGGHKSSEPNPLDAVAFGPDATTNSPNFWYEGSALTPNGAMVHPNRSQPGAPGQPCALVYDGDNIDLMQGTSIRFWVMPTDDPYAQDTEVLFSFMGSRDGKKRDVGFKVEKEFDPILGTVAIYLRWRSNDTVPGDDRLADGNWGGPLGNRLETSIDVTPNKSGAAPNPSQPEWLPGSWHWVVVNFGPQTLFPNVGQSATLQIDKAITQTLSSNVINMGVIQNGNPSGVYYGEVHAQNGGSTFPVQWYFDGSRLNHFGYYGSACTGWRTDRLLGDWYHCDMGGTVSVTNGQQTFQNAVVWDPNAGGGNGNGNNGNGNGGNNGASGGYVISSSFPPSPFPDGSYDRQLVIDFVNKSNGQSDHTANMVPANGTGMGNTGWTYNFTTTDMGPDGLGGTADDFQINIIAKWKTSGVTGGQCTCCTDCGTHDETSKRYWGRNNDNGGKCWMKYKAPPPTDLAPAGIGHGGLQGFVNPDPLPMQYICDQCHGCEACDVDGPMFFGGEPSGDNYDASGAVSEVNPTTVARAVFDNIIIKNNKERRTDDPTAKKFEDRFFESSLAMASALNDLNFGAVYRRGLLELQGFRARLGTLSWTSYPSTDNSIDFLPALYRMPGGNGSGAPTFSSTNPSALNTRLSGTANGQAYGMVNGRPIGWRFSTETPIDTTGDNGPPVPATPYPKEILVLSVELSRLLTSSNANVAASQRQTLLPQPLVETPIFEDVTLTLLLESPQIMYAEEGVDE